MILNKYITGTQNIMNRLLQRSFLKSLNNGKILDLNNVRSTYYISVYTCNYCTTVHKYFNTSDNIIMNLNHNQIKRRRYDNDFYNFDSTIPSVSHNQSYNINNCAPVMRANCGQLRLCDSGKHVEVVGKMVSQKSGKFIYLKDTHGTTQVVVPEYRTDLSKRFLNMPLNSYISVIGQVTSRPVKSKNVKMATGEIEIVIDRFEMIKVNRGPNFTNRIQNMPTRQYSTSPQHNLALTAEEYKLCSGYKYYEEHLKSRNATCGSLNSESKNKLVEIIGWTHRLMLPKFLHIKDGYGTVQCILNGDMDSCIKDIKSDTLIKVVGIVSSRPNSCINLNSETGDIEIIVKSLSVINPNEKPEEKISQKDCDLPVSEEKNGVNSFCWRTHTCGELTSQNAGERVRLFGWLENQRMNKFFIIRDAYGSTQCVINDENNKSIEHLTLESILEVEGLVATRPQNNINPAMLTGSIEIVVDKIKIHNSATFHPFSIKSFQKAKEPLRMQYKYLDLRFPEMQMNLRLRSAILMNMRKYLCDYQKFVEVETPTLFCRTPGGAQEFVVPTRHKGMFYSLVQSPQQFKQILMAGSVDRYFQIARCYRDETVRGDRQPEFTQLDIEMSFVGREEIINLTEGLLRHSWPEPLPDVIPKITYKEAMEKYGSDKPDLNINCEIKNISDILKPNHGETNDYISLAILLKKIHIGKSCKQLLTAIINNQSKVKGFIRKINENSSELASSIPTNTDIGKQMIEYLGVEPNDWLFVAYGPWEETCLCMGELRMQVSNHSDTKQVLRANTSETKPLWVVDFPLFTKSDDGIHLQSCHHPFTAPHPEDVHFLDTEPLKVRSLAYDLVLNGNEVGGGSVRAHDVNLQKKLLRILNIPELPLNHLLQALASGCPPHAGIALGLDRLIMLACGATSIRDVIAFPKSTEGRDLLSGAPSAISQSDQDIYHINIV